jgi:hypothetical protein
MAFLLSIIYATNFNFLPINISKKYSSIFLSETQYLFDFTALQLKNKKFNFFPAK